MDTYRGVIASACFSLHCLQWARNPSTIGSIKHGISMTLGIVSVISWGIAEVPQIITNYKQKSTEGLSLAFLLTWLIGDLFNLTGCFLEPATLPTQFYMALLYTVTTLVLAAQTIYYGNLYPRHKGEKDTHSQREQKSCHGEMFLEEGHSRYDKEESEPIRENASRATSSLPIPVAGLTLRRNGSSERFLYYMSARSLSKSPIPTVGSWLARSHQNSVSIYERHNEDEPLLDNAVPTLSPVNSRRMFCVVSVILFTGILNLHLQMKSTALDDASPGMLILVGRKLLQVNVVNSSILRHGGSGEGIGFFLGWAMAVIYMGGRLPQICLNIKRGRVEGLNPLMFIFALVGNATYVGSILVNSLEWTNIHPNLPWLVDAGGCVVLDAFILIQVAYLENSRRHREGAQEQI